MKSIIMTMNEFGINRFLHTGVASMAENRDYIKRIDVDVFNHIIEQHHIFSEIYRACGY